MTDTGTSCMIGPSAEVSAITDLLLANLSYYATDNSWGYLFWCSELTSMPNLNMLYGEYWFEVRPEDYGVVVGTSGGENVCAFCFSATSINYWILGDSFMRGWYVIHDHQSAR